MVDKKDESFYNLINKTIQLFRDTDSEDEGKQSFNLADKLSSKKFPEYRQYFVKDKTGHQVDLAYFQR